MNIEDVREYCLSKPLVTEDMPFGDGYVTFRISDKIFCCLAMVLGNVVQLKWSPDEFDETIDTYPWVKQAWHWHKKHMIQFDLSDQSIPTSDVEALIDRAYYYTISKMPKKEQNRIKELISSN